MVCSLCKGADHNKRTCVRRQIAKAAEDFKKSAGEEIKETAQEEITTKVYEELAAKEIAEEAAWETAEFFIDCACLGLGCLIKVTRYAYKAATYQIVKK
jgi:hypothetical protein